MARQAKRAKRFAIRNKAIRKNVKAGITIAEIARKYLITRGWVKLIAGIPPGPRSICQHARAAAIVWGRLSGLTFGLGADGVLSPSPENPSSMDDSALISSLVQSSSSRVSLCWRTMGMPGFFVLGWRPWRS